jgi:hypothetical protein
LSTTVLLFGFQVAPGALVWAIVILITGATTIAATTATATGTITTAIAHAALVRKPGKKTVLHDNVQVLCMLFITLFFLQINMATSAKH